MKPMPAPKIILILLAGFLLLAACTNESLRKYAEHYQDPEGRFQFDFPSSWGIIPESDLKFRNKKFITGVMKADTPSTAVGVIVQEAQKDKPFSFDYDSYSKKVKDDLSTHYEKFELLDMQKIERNGISGISLSYTFNAHEKTFVRQKQLQFVTPQDIYYLSGSSLIDNYDRFENELDFIFDSFEVTAVSEDKL